MRLAAALLFALAACRIHAAIDHFDVTSRTVVLGGQEFGAAGSFEKIVGRVYFKVKPGDPHNRVIVDLDKVPVEASGDVEFSADFYLLRPTAMEKSNGALLLEIPNRGGKAIQWLVDGGTHSWDPSSKRDFGDVGSYGRVTPSDGSAGNGT